MVSLVPLVAAVPENPLYVNLKEDPLCYTCGSRFLFSSYDVLRKLTLTTVKKEQDENILNCRLSNYKQIKFLLCKTDFLNISAYAQESHLWQKEEY